MDKFTKYEAILMCTISQFYFW